MQMLVFFLAVLVIFSVLWDAFETVVLPRRVSRRFRISSIIFRITWIPWDLLLRRFVKTGSRREYLFSLYGPLSLIGLLATWIVVLLVSFATIQWSLGSQLVTANGGHANFPLDLYMSGTTIFTLGLGDVTPVSPAARFWTVIEGGTGFGLLALVIGYLPVIYQAFSRREAEISMLDARAGSPPSAVELLRRHCLDDRQGLQQFLHDWEHWCAELMESHLSYPTLAFFRSQHEHQSWVAAITMLLDACSIILAGPKELPHQTARLTFAIARHAVVDLSQNLDANPRNVAFASRLTESDRVVMHRLLNESGVTWHADYDKKLDELRALYEPYAAALAHRLEMPLPPWLPPEQQDDWETSIWEHQVGTHVVMPARFHTKVAPGAKSQEPVSGHATN